MHRSNTVLFFESDLTIDNHRESFLNCLYNKNEDALLEATRINTGVKQEIKKQSAQELVNIGIIGGMGQDAGYQFLGLLFDACHHVVAQAGMTWCDQKTPNVFFINKPVPDRTQAILEFTKTGAMTPQSNPYPILFQMAQACSEAGVTHAVIACNTAHFWLASLKEAFPHITFISLIETTVKTLQTLNAKQVGLMATTGTIEANIYQQALMQVGINCLPVSQEIQERLMTAIYKGVKANNHALAKKVLIKVSQDYLSQGADFLVLGCTEISIAGLPEHLMQQAVNPGKLATNELARIFYGKKLNAD
jgi:aspartate racemase